MPHSPSIKNGVLFYTDFFLLLYLLPFHHFHPTNNQQIDLFHILNNSPAQDKFWTLCKCASILQISIIGNYGKILSQTVENNSAITSGVTVMDTGF